MESATSRERNELARQQSIQRQIAQLQAQLLDPNAPSYAADAPTHARSLEDTKRKRPEVAVLAPASPEPKKRRKAHPVRTDRHRNTAASVACDDHTMPSAVIPPRPAPSNVLSKLSTFSKRPPSPVEPDAPVRSSSFADKPSGALARDDSLTLIEQLEPGPYEHKPPFDDPLFERLEPHSGIRLASRKLPYEDLQDYMAGRYYISPSKLYSVIRASPGAGPGARGQVFDVPVVGDWVTIAVVAERGPIRVSRAPVGLGPGEARDADSPDATTPTTSIPPSARNSKSSKNKDQPPPIAGRKYVNLTLVDFGASGQKGTSCGDATLSLLLFESDSYDTVSRGNNLLPEKIYKGGSRGAFEAMAKLREGSVIALLNPRVLKPLQKPGAPNVLALTPENMNSAAIIGTASDLGMCNVVKRDGKSCGSWCDKRVSDVCDYHVQRAVERRRAGRPEFSAGTSGMGVGSSSQKHKASYDPQRKWGLSPAEGTPAPSADATYIVAGHVVAGSGAGKRDLFLSESVGREAQARAARQANSRDTDAALKRLLKRDKEGMKAVQAARDFAKHARDKEAKKALGKDVKLSVLEKRRRRKGEEEDGEDDDDDVSDDGGSASNTESDDSDGVAADADRSTKNAYSARVIKELGFDPTRGRHKRKGDDDSQNLCSKLTELASCRKLDKISLGPRPGGRVLSVVSAPMARHLGNGNSGGGPSGGMVDLDESSEDETEPPAVPP